MDRISEMIKHVRPGHRTKLVLNTEPCGKLVMEFEESSQAVLDTNIVGAVVEYKYDDWKEETIKSDATAALGFAGRTDGTGKMKHIDLREAWIEELKSDDIIRVKVPGTSNEADPLTKILSLSDFQDDEDAIMPRLK